MHILTLKKLVPCPNVAESAVSYSHDTRARNLYKKHDCANVLRQILMQVHSQLLYKRARDRAAFCSAQEIFTRNNLRKTIMSDVQMPRPKFLV